MARVVVAVLLVLGVPLSACGAPSGPDPCAPIVAGGTTRDVDTAGTRLHVTLAGPPGAPAVVLLHGFPETSATWRAVAADLAADHRVVVPDLRGAGCSRFAPPGTDAYAATDLATDLTDLADALGLPPATVVGHDLGAMTAVAWARARPEHVARLVISGGGVPGYGLAELGPPHLRTFGDAPPGAVEAAERPRLREFLAAFTGSPAFPLDEAVAAYAPPGRLDAAMGRYRALDRDADAQRADPRPLAMPVLVVAGGVPDLSAATVTALRPDRRVVVVPGAGHYVLVEQPAAFADAVRAEAR
ncbi:alpha/beta fold hydrolase [Actinomycetospora straminea]|uniref:Alpha/beta hydrolase n=1 Tax=Actinomycetospora straminea TaxID=663607 RepID=A0ABP9EYY2_9PSEU|nr:alpha/beta hydrolase [Actinomycetospora straminea]MDD7931778.1 alpha/beta hydrolase [Actinomycetospora straminea]